MKKLITICFLLASTFTISAQVSGPTKEKTVQFISDYYKQPISPCREVLEVGNQSATRTINNITTQFDSNNSVMTLYYEFRYYYLNLKDNLKDNQIYKYKILIDFSKIESISLSSTKFADCQIVYLNFKAAPGTNIDSYEAGGYDDESKIFSATPSKVIDIDIPIKAYNCDGCDDFAVNKKIIQAFNHLRKLDGAPEPISFD